MIGIGTPAENDGDDRELLVQLVRQGEVVGREPLDTARDRHAATRAELPPAPSRCRVVSPSSPPSSKETTDMALVTCDFFSESLMVGTSITVVLPQETEEQIGLVDEVRDGPPPVLYLLHGLSDDHTAWLRYTSIERYAAARGLAVVMPAAGRSFYADEAHGHRYWTYLSEELPRVVGQFFRVSQEPADTFVAGLSMGGYGALKLALTHPERYAAAACLSGALDLVAFSKRPDRDEVDGPRLRPPGQAERRPVRAARRQRRRSRRSTSRAAPRTG